MEKCALNAGPQGATAFRRNLISLFDKCYPLCYIPESVQFAALTG